MEKPMRLSEAIRSGSLLVKRTNGTSYVSGRGCALQMAALAAGRPDLAYPWGVDYLGLQDLFNVREYVIYNVWLQNDRLKGISRRGSSDFYHTIDQIADWVATQEQLAQPEVAPVEPPLAPALP